MTLHTQREEGSEMGHGWHHVSLRKQRVVEAHGS